MLRKRKQKLVKSRLQLRMTAVFLAVACASAMFQVVLLNWSLLRFARDYGVESGELLEGLPGMLGTNLALTALVLVPAILFFGIQVTHRIAGPIYRFERYLEDVAAGTETGSCRIRDTDELQELCDKLNRAVTTLRGQEKAEEAETPSTGADRAQGPLDAAA